MYFVILIIFIILGIDAFFDDDERDYKTVVSNSVEITNINSMVCCNIFRKSGVPPIYYKKILSSYILL